LFCCVYSAAPVHCRITFTAALRSTPFLCAHLYLPVVAAHTPAVYGSHAVHGYGCRTGSRLRAHCDLHTAFVPLPLTTRCGLHTWYVIGLYAFLLVFLVTVLRFHAYSRTRITHTPHCYTCCLPLRDGCYAFTHRRFVPFYTPFTTVLTAYPRVTLRATHLRYFGYILPHAFALHRSPRTPRTRCVCVRDLFCAQFTTRVCRTLRAGWLRIGTLFCAGYPTHSQFYTLRVLLPGFPATAVRIGFAHYNSVPTRTMVLTAQHYTHAGSAHTHTHMTLDYTPEPRITIPTRYPHSYGYFVAVVYTLHTPGLLPPLLPLFSVHTVLPHTFPTGKPHCGPVTFYVVPAGYHVALRYILAYVTHTRLVVPHFTLHPTPHTHTGLGHTGHLRLGLCYTITHAHTVYTHC